MKTTRTKSRRQKTCSQVCTSTHRQPASQRSPGGHPEERPPVTWTSNNTSKSHLFRSVLKPPPCTCSPRCHSCATGLLGRCHSSGIVHQLTCELCSQSYIGETGPSVHLRYNEHLRDAKNMRAVETHRWATSSG